MSSASNYRNGHVDSSGSDSDDSDSDIKCWKRSSKEPSSPQVMVVTPTVALDEEPVVCQKRKVNNIWSSVLEEREVSEILNNCGFKRKPITLREQNCESYDFRAALTDTRPYVESNDMDVDYKTDKDWHLETDVDKKEKWVRKHLKDKDLEVAKKVIRILNEKKTFLIYRIVQIVGRDKAMDLLKRTEEVEDSGGIMTKDNSRRRTPGGVFIQLLKSEKCLTKKQLDSIFPNEKDFLSHKKKFMKKKKKRKPRRPPMVDANPCVPSINGSVTSAMSEILTLSSSIPSEETLPSSTLPSAEGDMNTSINEVSDVEDGEIIDD